MRKLFVSLLGIALFAASLPSCRSGKTLFRDQDPVPADFGKEPTTILVLETDQKKVNKALESSFSKYYKGSFEMVGQTDLNNKKYSDTKKYRYCFRTKTQFQPASGMGNTRMAASYNYSYDVWDRMTMKANGLDFYGASYKGLMDAYVKRLEETRQKNSK